MNVTVLFKQLMVLNNTLYLFFSFFHKLLHRPEKGLFCLLYGNFLLLWLLTAQQNVLFGEYRMFYVSFSPFFKI